MRENTDWKISEYGHFSGNEKRSVKGSSLTHFKTMMQFYSPLKTWDNKRFSGGIEMKYWPKMA